MGSENSEGEVEYLDHVLDDQVDHISSMSEVIEPSKLSTYPVSFDDNMSEVIVPSILDDSIDELLDYVSNNLGLDSLPDDYCARGDDIVEPPNEIFDFEGFESKDPQDYYSSFINRGHYGSLNDINVPVQSSLNVCPKRALRPSRHPMDDQFDWDRD